MLRRMRELFTAALCGPVLTVAVPAIAIAQAPSGLIRPGVRPVQARAHSAQAVNQTLRAQPSYADFGHRIIRNGNTGISSSGLVKDPRRAAKIRKTKQKKPATLIRPVSASDEVEIIAPPVEFDGAPGQHMDAVNVYDVNSGPAHVNLLDTNEKVPTFGRGLITPDSAFSHDPNRMELITPYLSRIQEQDRADQHENQDVSLLPKKYRPWWTKGMGTQNRTHATPVNVSLEQLSMAALQHSSQVQALTVDPAIHQYSVIVEDADFDWRGFVDTTWDDLSDPVGNTLTTGGSPRFRDHRLSVTGGLRRKTRAGGELELSQQLGFQDNNSNFFVPTQQGQTRLAVNFTQPLMRESGVVYNQGRIILAQLDSDVVSQRVMADLQDHISDVAEYYWELYRARAVNLQKARLLERAELILERLEARQNVDVLERQVLRARAAVSSRQSEIARARAAIRNAEAKLRFLVNDPRLTIGTFELLPSDTPLYKKPEVSMAESLEIALQNRPDITEAIKQLRSTSVRLGIAKRDLLPKLDLVLGAYLAGLEGGSDVQRAWGNQFTEGEPGYSIGLLFEVPIGNRAARVRQEQRELQMFKAMQEFKVTVENALTEVEIAVREAQTSHREMFSRYQAMLASEQEAMYLEDRWKSLPGADKSTGFLLEDLLDSQERSAAEESQFVQAQVSYMLALVGLKRSTGMLMQEVDGPNKLTQKQQQEQQLKYLRDNHPAVFSGTEQAPPLNPEAEVGELPVPPKPINTAPQTDSTDASENSTDGLIRVPRSKR